MEEISEQKVEERPSLNIIYKPPSEYPEMGRYAEFLENIDVIVGAGIPDTQPPPQKNYSAEEIESIKNDQGILGQVVRAATGMIKRAQDENRPAAYSFADPTKPAEKVCVVVAPGEDDMQSHIASMSTKFAALSPLRYLTEEDSKEAQRIQDRQAARFYPGSDADWNAYIMMHENAHCADLDEHGTFRQGRVTAFSSVKMEASADWQANADYYAAYKQGLVSDPEVPYAFRAARAMHTMAFGHVDYAVNGVVALPGEKDPLKGYDTIASVSNDILGAREKILIQITESAHDVESMKGMTTHEIIEKGAYLAQTQPGLAYETTRQMLAADAFNDNPAGKKFAENFVDGVQRYMPEAHGVAPEYRPTERPEIVDRLAQQYAPVPQPTHTSTFSLQ